MALFLLRLWLRGWRPVDGWTVIDRESNGDIYIAMQLRKRRSHG
jgi:hypothetical protein